VRIVFAVLARLCHDHRRRQLDLVSARAPPKLPISSRAAAGIAQTSVDFIGLSPPGRAARHRDRTFSQRTCGTRTIVHVRGAGRIMTVSGRCQSNAGCRPVNIDAHFCESGNAGETVAQFPFHDVTKTSRLLLPQCSIAFSAVHNSASSAISAALEPAEPALEGTWGHEEIFRHRFAIRRRHCRQRRAGDYAHGA
jgi:hypothetical protein